eukprot:Polyplicarium_translucidae@DN2710_c0_g1_i1.p1
MMTAREATAEVDVWLVGLGHPEECPHCPLGGGSVHTCSTCQRTRSGRLACDFLMSPAVCVSLPKSDMEEVISVVPFRNQPGTTTTPRAKTRHASRLSEGPNDAHATYSLLPPSCDTPTMGSPEDSASERYSNGGQSTIDAVPSDRSIGPRMDLDASSSLRSGQSNAEPRFAPYPGGHGAAPPYRSAAADIDVEAVGGHLSSNVRPLLSRHSSTSLGVAKKAAWSATALAIAGAVFTTVYFSTPPIHKVPIQVIFTLRTLSFPFLGLFVLRSLPLRRIFSMRHASESSLAKAMEGTKKVGHELALASIALLALSTFLSRSSLRTVPATVVVLSLAWFVELACPLAKGAFPRASSDRFESLADAAQLVVNTVVAATSLATVACFFAQ